MPLIQVTMVEGRTTEQKKGLMKDISDAVVKNANVPIDAVTVQIIEAPLIDKMKGGVVFADRAKK